jgi:hypothetical protein
MPILKSKKDIIKAWKKVKEDQTSSDLHWHELLNLFVADEEKKSYQVTNIDIEDLLSMMPIKQKREIYIDN